MSVLIVFLVFKYLVLLGKKAGSQRGKKSMYWQTSLLCIVIELARGGSMSVAVDVALAVQQWL